MSFLRSTTPLSVIENSICQIVACSVIFGNRLAIKFDQEKGNVTICRIFYASPKRDDNHNSSPFCTLNLPPPLFTISLYCGRVTQSI